MHHRSETIRALIYNSVTPENWLGTGGRNSVFRIHNPAGMRFDDIAVRVPNAVLGIDSNTVLRPKHIERDTLKMRLNQTSALKPVIEYAPLLHVADPFFACVPPQGHDEGITLIDRAQGDSLLHTMYSRMKERGPNDTPDMVKKALLDEITPFIPALIEDLAYRAYHSDDVLDTYKIDNIVYTPCKGLFAVDTKGGTRLPLRNDRKENAKNACHKCLNEIFTKLAGTNSLLPDSDNFRSYDAMITATVLAVDKQAKQQPEANRLAVEKANHIEAIAITDPPHQLREALDHIHQQRKQAFAR
jgi:hypothetical protein